RNVLLASCLVALGGACASDDSDSTGFNFNPGGFTGMVTVPPRGSPIGSLKRVVPTDMRGALIAENPPVPITGGTLIVTGDGKYAVAADPDRDRVSIVDIGVGSAALARTVALMPGDESGRLAE